ncbi:F-box and associated interaction domains-containing protein [Rhynchospora pubera]|uniref:F-box and associated interaction domains-containing protein n=1 Tax=Rhynchospora pubera TaxID=906938 RepID=A0AAV8FVV1_9POAL|nr:F-box and associated interaction domains-containing protein [Rhynchospora pubera]
MQSNGEIWGGALPDDVVVEILSRLPPKPFFRSKCVSKTWLALSSPASRLNKHLQPTLRGFFWETRFQSGFTNISGGIDEVDATLSALPYHAVHDRCQIMDCCNGLLLVKCWFGCPTIEHMYVYNPATRKHIFIELLPPLSPKETFYGENFSLAFQPQDQSQFHVVCFRHSHNQNVCSNIFFTFSSNSGKWRQGENLECDLHVAYTPKPIFLDGKLHLRTEAHKVVSVDPKNNTSVVTNFDFLGLATDDISEIGQSQGLLHFMSLNEFHMMSIWVPETIHPQNWILKHQLSLDGMLFVSPWYWNLTLHPEKDALFVHLGNGRILSIELQTAKSNDICVFSDRLCSTFWLYMPCFLV